MNETAQPVSRAGDSAEPGPISALAVFAVFLRLGLTSFGGPIAHLAYFREAFVIRRRWLEDAAYADLVALCQFLPGPASSQVGMAIGLSKAGLPGAVSAWIGFTLPSALLMAGFGYLFLEHRALITDGLLHGLKLIAVAVVAQAVWGMARALAPDPPRASLAVLAALIVLILPLPLTQLGVIAGAGLAGLVLLKADTPPTAARAEPMVSRTLALGALILFFLLLFGLPVLLQAVPSRTLAMIDSFYRAGALVFGGGHVVLPLLQSSVVPQGWVSNDAFLAGYGAAQALPGPLFTFAAFLGTVMTGWPGALICLLAIFAPSFLLVIGTLPFWDGLRRAAPMRKALAGINAAMVGLLLAALYTPVWTSAVLTPLDFAIALAAFALLAFWHAPVLLVGALTLAAGWLSL